MSWISITAGIVLNVLVLLDIYQTLFAPFGGGIISTRIVRGVDLIGSQLALRWPAVQRSMGPIAFLTVIAIWFSSFALAWALIYWPALPDGFRFEAGVPEHQRQGLVDALYFSLVTMSSLGYGEVTPTVSWLRMAAPVQGLIGLALITGVISWIIAIHEALLRRRNLIRHILLLAQATPDELRQLAEEASLPAEAVALDLTAKVVAVESDVEHAPILGCFRSTHLEHDLPMALRLLASLLPPPGRVAAGTADAAGIMLQTATVDLMRAMGAMSEDIELAPGAEHRSGAAAD